MATPLNGVAIFVAATNLTQASPRKVRVRSD
jgi:hypothetical protein